MLLLDMIGKVVLRARNGKQAAQSGKKPTGLVFADLVADASFVYGFIVYTLGCFAKSLQKRTKKYGTRPRHFSHASHVVVLIVGASLASLSAPSYHWTRP